MNYSLIKLWVFIDKEDTSHFKVTEIDGLDEDTAFTQNITNLNFAVGVFPKTFGFFKGDIEDYLDVSLVLKSGRSNTVD